MKKAIGPTALLLIVFLLGGLLLSRDSSPLLETGRRHPFSSFYDRLAFAWHFTRANFLGKSTDGGKSLIDLARAVWHRPSFSREVFNLAPTNYLGLARQFESLGLTEEAGELFLAAYREHPDQEQTLISLLGCAGLEDWEKITLIADESTRDQPDFAAAYYWWGRALWEQGRPKEAEEKFLTTRLLNPEAGDIDYWLGRSYQAQGQGEEAIISYRKMTADAPGHREAWKALAEMEGEAGDQSAAAEAEDRVSSLTADFAAAARFGDRLLFLGWADLPSAGQGEKAFPFTLYCRFLPGTEGGLTPYLRFQAGHFQKKVILDPISSSQTSPGEILIKPSRPILPWDIVPLRMEVSIGFLDESEKPLRIFKSRDFELKLAEVEIKPALFSYPASGPIISRLPWKNLKDLQVRTVLAGEEMIEVETTGLGPAAAVGIISYTVGTIPFPQGTEIATLGGRGPGGMEFNYPIRLGQETADRWLESRSLPVRRHQTGEIVYSRRVEGERDFQWHFYLALLPLPESGPVEKIIMKYTSPEGGCWVVNNIFLLPEQNPSLVLE